MEGGGEEGLVGEAIGCGWVGVGMGGVEGEVGGVGVAVLNVGHLAEDDGEAGGDAWVDEAEAIVAGPVGVGAEEGYCAGGRRR